VLLDQPRRWLYWLPSLVSFLILGPEIDAAVVVTGRRFYGGGVVEDGVEEGASGVVEGLTNPRACQE